MLKGILTFDCREIGSDIFVQPATIELYTSETSPIIK